jgi:O-methyltransferase
MFANLQIVLKTALPVPLLNLLRGIRQWEENLYGHAIRNWRDLSAFLPFLLNGNLNVSLPNRFAIVMQLKVIGAAIESPHTQDEILNCIQTILQLPRNNRSVVVEAGCYKGSSTAKFSLATDIAGRQLVVFDSFKGIPDNDEPHITDIFGGSPSFKKGYYCGTLDEVKSNVAKYGKFACCRFIEGWFEDTMPKFQEPISIIYLDVDLASSTRTCLKYLYPLLEPGGVVFSQDGHLPLVIDVFNDNSFWLNEVGCKKPEIRGLGKSKLIKFIKE